jgi:hypothetical protein
MKSKDFNVGVCGVIQLDFNSRPTQDFKRLKDYKKETYESLF